MASQYQIIRMGKGWVVIDSKNKGAVVYADDSKQLCQEWIAWACSQGVDIR